VSSRGMHPADSVGPKSASPAGLSAAARRGVLPLCIHYRSDHQHHRHTTNHSTNKLMKRLEQLKREKQALATEVEQEEEMITNTLQKKLEKVRLRPRG